ncbi:MAG: hypothetical protein ACR2QK_02770 [Acidimicrobiales bacterium]
MKLVAVVVAALGALAIWRRADVKSGAERASKSAGDAASKARNKLRPADTEDGEEVTDSDDDTDAPVDPELAATD